MIHKLKNWGEFRSRSNDYWRVEILQKSDSDIIPVQLTFPSESPLTIEWNEASESEPIQSSSATLTVNSDTDRQFIDLYSVETCYVRMDVFRNGSLYWSGTLDTELYEEPYSNKQDYDVTLTFSDLAVLSRLKFDLKGFTGFRNLITDCLSRSEIRYNSLVSYISTNISPGDDILSKITFLCDNFYKDDKEPMPLSDVLSGILLPFALKIVQKNGNFIVYDLNKVYDTLTSQQIVWEADNAVLSTNKTYNNIKLTFTPSAEPKLIEASVKEKSVPESSDFALVYIDVRTLSSPIGFYAYMSPTGEGLKLSNGAKFCKIKSVYSGSNEDVVAYTVQLSVAKLNKPHGVFSDTTIVSKEIISLTDTAYIGSSTYSSYRLRVTTDLLFDVRYNPFEQPSLHNEEGNWARMQNWCNYAYIPIKIILRDSHGVAIWHYVNKDVMSSDSFEHTSARWVAGDAVWGDCYLCYYGDNLKTTSGLGGWKTNRNSIGYWRGELPASWNKMGNGEYIPMPPTSGWLDISIGSGVYQFDYGRKSKDIYQYVNWIMYRNIGAEVVDGYGNNVDIEDIEYTASINEAAEEELSLETIIGTTPSVMPFAKGLIFDNNKNVITYMTRAGQTVAPEKLLLNTLYSNYADRHNVLSGTTRILTDFTTYTDNNDPNSKYVCVSEIQDINENTSEATFRAFSNDNFTSY